MRNLRLVLSYDGTDFHGWQRQADRRSVQQVLEETIERLTGVSPATNASGRTDAGVHAVGQVVNFLTPSLHSPKIFLKALNATLPSDVRVVSVEDVPERFHATLSAVSKRYRYVLDNGAIADPFLLRYAWHVYPKLDANRMHEAARGLIGRHDFRSFETHWPNRRTSVRTIFALEVRREGDRVVLEVEADGFLYNMVRAITGTLVIVGTGKRPIEFAAKARAAQARAEAGPTAPPQGLFLKEVFYNAARLETFCLPDRA